MANYFKKADILLPVNCDMARWAVIACDQHTSDPAYWERVRKYTEDFPTTLRLILPEAELADVDEKTIDRINATMQDYMAKGVFQEYRSSYVYVERTLQNGMIRQGIVGMLDLEHYEFDPARCPRISATESMVPDRLSPRVSVRKNAELELPHVLLLCEDEDLHMIEQIAAWKPDMIKLYEFDLMENGGHIAGWLLNDAATAAFEASLLAYEEKHIYLVGDGNHSLVTAKTCYENLKVRSIDAQNHPARYALAELENVFSPTMKFEPIHRVITDIDPVILLKDMQALCSADGVRISWIVGETQGEICVSVAEGELCVGVLQDFWDQWLATHPGRIDYIHGVEMVTALAKQPNTIGFLLPAMPKRALFPFVQGGRILPRKTFSMGHGSEKRYYLEGRKIK